MRVKMSSRPVELFGLALAMTSGREPQALYERDEVRTVLLQHGAADQRNRRAELVVAQRSVHSPVAREEAAAEPIGDGTQPEVDAGRLYVLENAAIGGVNPSLADSLSQVAIREHS